MTKKIHLFLVCILFVIGSSFTNTSEAYADSNLQRVRIDFKMPNGFVRHLLLSFTKDNSASDSYDYGYDAINKDVYPYDLNWMIGDLKCVIQGVGAFDDSKKYPLGMFMFNDGNIEISLDTLENFDSPIDLFIYDSQLDTYTQINDSNYAANIAKGDYLNRFYLAFKTDNASNSFAKNSLSTDEISLEDIKVNYLHNTKEIYVNTHDKFIIKTVNVHNLLGQQIFSLSSVNSKVIKIPFQTNQTKYGIITIETDEGGHLSKQIVIN
ncbi:hypothetical protein V8G69_05290 [Gaetbulibacter sp. M235]|uniref:hypothetical protein n=1 Tax=Gaetbulibacter sp. M235 TaxID=3126510 RepID=UPI00374F3AFC